MSILNNLIKQQSKSTLETLDTAQNTVSTGGFILESDVYEMKIKDAYTIMSKHGAIGIRLILGYGDNFDEEYREDVYISNKDKQFTYLDKKTNKEKPLPGYSLINDICGVTVDANLATVSENTVEQMKKVYNFESKSEVNESHDTLVDLIDQILLVGITKAEETKKEFGSDGKLYATDKTRMVNHIHTVFTSDTKNTLYELDHAEGDEAPEAKAYEAFIKVYQGKTLDKTDKDTNKGATANNSGSSASPAPRRSLRRNV